MSTNSNYNVTGGSSSFPEFPGRATPDPMAKAAAEEEDTSSTGAISRRSSIDSMASFVTMSVASSSTLGGSVTMHRGGDDDDMSKMPVILHSLSREDLRRDSRTEEEEKELSSISPEQVIFAVQKEMQEITQRRVEALNLQLEKCSQKKQQILQKIINVTDPGYINLIARDIGKKFNERHLEISDLKKDLTVIVKSLKLSHVGRILKEIDTATQTSDFKLMPTPEEQREEFRVAIKEFKQILKDECQILNERAYLLEQKGFNKEEIEQYISHAVEKETQHFELRMRLFAPQTRENLQAQALYSDLLKGGSDTFNQWVQAYNESSGKSAYGNLPQYITAPLEILVTNARVNRKDREVLQSLISSALEHSSFLAWEDIPLEELERTSIAMIFLTSAMKSVSSEAVPDNTLKNMEEWERWVEEILRTSAAVSRHIHLMTVQMSLHKSTDFSNKAAEELFQSKILLYTNIFINISRVFFVGKTSDVEALVMPQSKTNTWKVEEYVNQVSKEIEDSQHFSVEALKAKQVALDKELTTLYIQTITKIREENDKEVSIEKFLSDYTERVSLIHASLEKNSHLLQKFSREQTSNITSLQEILKVNKKKIFQTYVRYAIKSFNESDGNNVVRFDDAFKYAFSYVTNSNELIKIIRNEIPKISSEVPYEKRSQLIDKLEHQVLDTCKDKIKSVPTEIQPAYSKVGESSISRRKRGDALEAQKTTLEADLLLRFKMAQLHKVSGAEELGAQEALKVSEFEAARAWEYSNNRKETTQRDLLMQNILVTRNSPAVSKWIKQGDFKSLDHLIDYALRNASFDADGELDLSNLEGILRDAVSKSPRETKTLKTMLEHIEERANIEKWKHIEDPHYANIYSRIVGAVRDGITQAIPNPRERSPVLRKIFS